MKGRNGNILLILVLAIGVLAATYPFTFSMQFLGVKKDLIARRNGGREDDLMNFVFNNVDCTATKAATCTSDIALLTVAGVAFIPAALTKIGPFNVIPHCNGGTNEITLELTLLTANSTPIIRQVCD